MALSSIPQGPATLYVTWERSSTGAPLEPTLSPQVGFSVEALLDLVPIRTDPTFPKGQELVRQVLWLVPSWHSKKQFPKQAPPGGPAKNQEEWGPPSSLAVLRPQGT